MANGLLYAREFAVTNTLSIHVPTIREVLGCYEHYYSIVSAVISTPSDLMVQLEDMGIDFMKMNDFTLFCIVFYDLQERQKKRARKPRPCLGTWQGLSASRLTHTMIFASTRNSG